MVSSTTSPTGMTLYQQMGDPVNAVVVIGTAIAKSRLFGCETVEQGQVLALECMVRGMPPLTLAEKYHLIQGKLSMRADAMLAEFSECHLTIQIPNAKTMSFFAKPKSVSPKM